MVVRRPAQVLAVLAAIVLTLVALPARAEGGRTVTLWHSYRGHSIGLNRYSSGQ